MSSSRPPGRASEPGATPAGGAGSNVPAGRRSRAGHHGGEPAEASWLWDHAGRLSGIALGLLALAALVFLAAIGFRPALFLVVLLVAGVVIIAVGGRIRSA